MQGFRTIIASLVVLILIFSAVPIQNQNPTQLDHTQSAGSSTLTLNEPPPPQNEPPPHEALLWNRTFGGTGYDYAEEIIECSDGGFAIIGSTQSFGAGSYDAWLIHVDADGNHLWNHIYGYCNIRQAVYTDAEHNRSWSSIRSSRQPISDVFTGYSNILFPDSCRNLCRANNIHFNNTVKRNRKWL